MATGEELKLPHYACLQSIITLTSLAGHELKLLRGASVVNIIIVVRIGIHYFRLGRCFTMRFVVLHRCNWR